MDWSTLSIFSVAVVAAAVGMGITLSIVLYLSDGPVFETDHDVVENGRDDTE